MTHLMLLLAAEAAAAVAAMRVSIPHVSAALGAAPLMRRLPAGDLAVLLLHVVAPLAAAWLLLGTLHDIATAISGGTRAGHTPRWVRRMVDQAIGSAVLVGVMAGPAAAVIPPRSPVVQQAAEAAPSPPPVLSPPTAALPLPATDAPPVVSPPDHDVDVAPTVGATPAQDPTTTPDPDRAGVHVVSPGENLWVIARGALVAAGVEAPGDRRVHAYWVRVIEQNLPTLRSGDADLVFPGERLRLPDVEPGR